MRGCELRRWVWTAIAVVLAAVLAVACSSDTDEQQAQSEAAAPPTAANAPSAAGATEEMAQQQTQRPAQSEPIQWSYDRCANRMEDVSFTFADSLQVGVADLRAALRNGETAYARFVWERSIQPTLDATVLAERELAEHCAQQLASLEEFLEVSEGWRQGIEEELAFISASREQFDEEGADWSSERCARRYEDFGIYFLLFNEPGGPLDDLEEAVNRADRDLAERIGATRVEPALEEFRAALSDVTEHCEPSESVPAEAVDNVEYAMELAPDLLADVEERYADLVD